MLLKSYVAELNRQAAEQHVAEQAQQAAKAAAERDLATLDGKLKRLLSTIPAEVQAEGLSIVEVQTMLRPPGSERSCATAGQLGDALRRFGFVRERRWHDGRLSFRALWRKRQVSPDRGRPSTLLEDA